MENNYECIIYLYNLFKEYGYNDNKLSAQDCTDIENLLEHLLRILAP